MLTAAAVELRKMRLNIHHCPPDESNILWGHLQQRRQLCMGHQDLCISALDCSLASEALNNAGGLDLVHAPLL